MVLSLYVVVALSLSGLTRKSRNTHAPSRNCQMSCSDLVVSLFGFKYYVAIVSLIKDYYHFPGINKDKQGLRQSRKRRMFRSFPQKKARGGAKWCQMLAIWSQSCGTKSCVQTNLKPRKSLYGSILATK